MKHPADVNPLTFNSLVKIFSNGDWIGVSNLSDANDIYNMLKIKKREGIIDKYTSIAMDFTKREIKIYYDGGRLIRPILVVKDNKLGLTPEVILDIQKELENKDSSKGWKKILSKYQNLVEYEDIESSSYIMCADRFYRLEDSENAKNRKIDYTDSSKINRYGDYRWIKYTHCDFHAWTQLGLIAGNIPFSNHNNAGRNIIHFSQAK
jgi:DNA-directed RNA polymerase beta subunit